MRNFLWIFRHYMKKNFLTPANLLVIGLPLVFVAAFYLMDNYFVDLLGIDIAFLFGIIVPMVLGFQFFGAGLTTDWLHQDMQGAIRARLLVSPVGTRVFYAGVVVAGWLFNVFYGVIVVAVTAVVFGGDFGNYGLLLVVLLILSFFTQLVGLLVYFFSKDEKSGTRVTYVFGEIMIGLSVLPYTFNADGAVVAFFNRIPLPVGTGLNIIHNENLPYNLAVLLGMVAVLAVVVFILGRQKHDSL